MLILSTESRLLPRHSVRYHYMCPYCTSGHSPQRLLLGHYHVRSLADRLLRAPDLEYPKTHQHGLILWVVCVDPGLYPVAARRTRTNTAKFISCLPYGRTRSFTWSWEGWSTTSHPRQSSSESRLGDSRSISYFSISCESYALHQFNVADIGIRAFVIQVAGASMASGDHVPTQTILRGLQ